MRDFGAAAIWPTRARRVLEGIARTFVGWQIQRAGLMLLAAAAVTIAAFGVARRLELYTQFERLLPESQPSVREYRRVSSRLRSQSKVFIVLEGGDSATLRRMGDALTTRLDALGPPAVEHAEDGLHEARSFLLPRAALFASVDELRGLRDDLQGLWDRAVGRALDVDFDDEPGAEPAAKWDGDRIKRLLGKRAEIVDHFPDGYYQSAGALVVALYTGIRPGDLPGAQSALGSIQREVDKIRTSAEYAGVKVGYAGDLVTGLGEYGAVRDDLVNVGAIGVSLVLGVILLYFMRLRSLLVLGCAIAAGCTWTFALTRLTIGHLNVATGFLFSILAGNGINCGIIYLARYYEERELGHDVATSIRVAHRETWVPTLTAALAAAAAYASLSASDFRGLKHFALIGGAGMVLCWIATYAIVPPLLVLLEKRFPTHAPSKARRRFRFDAPFAVVVGKAPQWVALAGVCLAVAGVAAGASYFRTDPIEYDMKRLFNQMGASADQKRLSTVARDIVGIDGESSMSIVCDDVDQVPRLAKALEERRSAAPEKLKPFEAVHTLGEFVPDEQLQKIPLAMEIRRLVLAAHQRGLIEPETWASVEPYLPAASIQPFGIDALPAAIARPFTEKDGTRGRIVHIEPTHGEDEDDAHYLIRWADSFRETPISSHETILGSGRVVIFADMLRAVLADVPRATVMSLALTVLVIVAATGFTWEAVAVLGSLLGGVAWLFVFIVLLRIKLNFLNFIALPITFGIGVDYAVNIVRRYRDGRGESAIEVLRRTGGAVVLCSLTTIVGYLALVGSKNQAVHSLGLLAVLGEVCCLGAAMLVLPAFLVLIERQRRGRADPTRELSAEGS
jgi:predicted exporter